MFFFLNKKAKHVSSDVETGTQQNHRQILESTYPSIISLLYKDDNFVKDITAREQEHVTAAIEMHNIIRNQDSVHWGATSCQTSPAVPLPLKTLCLFVV